MKYAEPQVHNLWRGWASCTDTSQKDKKAQEVRVLQINIELTASFKLHHCYHRACPATSLCSLLLPLPMHTSYLPPLYMHMLTHASHKQGRAVACWVGSVSEHIAEKIKVRSICALISLLFINFLSLGWFLIPPMCLAWFPHLSEGGNNTYFTALWWGLNELLYEICSAKHLVPTKKSAEGNY